MPMTAPVAITVPVAMSAPVTMSITMAMSTPMVMPVPTATVAAPTTAMPAVTRAEIVRDNRLTLQQPLRLHLGRNRILRGLRGRHDSAERERRCEYDSNRLHIFLLRLAGMKPANRMWRVNAA